MTGCACPDEEADKVFEGEPRLRLPAHGCPKSPSVGLRRALRRATGGRAYPREPADPQVRSAIGGASLGEPPCLREKRCRFPTAAAPTGGDLLARRGCAPG
jgi:hypothetical protein